METLTTSKEVCMYSVAHSTLLYTVAQRDTPKYSVIWHSVLPNTDNFNRTLASLINLLAVGTGDLQKRSIAGPISVKDAVGYHAFNYFEMTVMRASKCRPLHKSTFYSDSPQHNGILPLSN